MIYKEDNSYKMEGFLLSEDKMNKSIDSAKRCFSKFSTGQLVLFLMIPISKRAIL